jgi:hypothetical protein
LGRVRRDTWGGAPLPILRQDELHAGLRRSPGEAGDKRKRYFDRA